MTTEWDIELEEEVTEEVKPITVEELDEAVKQYSKAREEVDLHESVGKRLNEAVRIAETKLMNYLKQTKKDSYRVTGIGNVSLVKKLQVNTPQGENKTKLFKWIEEKYGQDGLTKYQSIHYQSLQSLYNEVALEAEINKEQINIPGLDLPTIRETLSLRRTR